MEDTVLYLPPSLAGVILPLRLQLPPTTKKEKDFCCATTGFSQSLVTEKIHFALVAGSK